MANKKETKVKAEVEIKKDKRNLQYHFNDEEIVKLAKQLAEDQNTLRRLETDRKMVADEWKSKISSKEADIFNISNKVSSGYEYRDIPVEIRINEPVGKKTIIRLDTKEVVAIEDLTDFERQRTLEFDPEAKSKEVNEE